jgi:hypothetical protein
MRNTLSLFACFALLFTSCQKEITLDVPNSGNTGTGGSNGSGGSANAGGITGGTDGTILLKAVRKTGSDSVTATFTYNSADKFMSYVVSGKEKYDTFNLVYNIQKYLTRDAAGRVTKVVSPSTIDTTFFGAADSSRTVVYYPSPTSTEFRAMVTTTDAVLMKAIDSTVFTFSNGKVVSYLTYSYNDLIPAPPTLSGKGEYVYDAADNVLEIKQYAQAQLSTQLTLVSKATYTWDNKPSGTAFKNEGFFIDGGYWNGHNPLTGTIVNYQNGTTGTISAAYNYNSSNYPKNGQLIASNPSRTYTQTYYYR